MQACKKLIFLIRWKKFQVAHWIKVAEIEKGHEVWALRRWGSCLLDAPMQSVQNVIDEIGIIIDHISPCMDWCEEKNSVAMKHNVNAENFPVDWIRNAISLHLRPYYLAVGKQKKEPVNFIISCAKKLRFHIRPTHFSFWISPETNKVEVKKCPWAYRSGQKKTQRLPTFRTNKQPY